MLYSKTSHASGTSSGFYFEDDKNAPADSIHVTDADVQTAINLPVGSTYDFDATGKLTTTAPTPAYLQAQAQAAMAAGKTQALAEARALRLDILERLNGIHLTAIYNNDVPPIIAAIMVAKQALLNITIDPTVVAATDYATTKAAVLARYYAIATTLGATAPTAVSAFVGLDN